MPGIETGLQLFCDIACGGIELDFLYMQPCSAAHHLYWFRQAFPHYRSAQNVMAVNDYFQHLYILVQTFSVWSAEQRGRQIDIAFLSQQMVEEDAFLQRRQRIDVLHIGR